MNMLTLPIDFYKEPPSNCPLCPRLKEFRENWRQKEPTWHNSPVPPFFPKAGLETIKLLIIGLAPGLRGANKTGRPFTGDYAGHLLYDTLKKYGFAKGEFLEDPKDSLELINTGIINAVRCVPPENKPLPQEIHTCRQFFAPLLFQLPNLQAIVTLGTIAHESTIRAFKEPVKNHPFQHHKVTQIGKIKIFSSYHCSRYNTNTNRLTTAMFQEIFADVSAYLKNNAIN